MIEGITNPACMIINSEGYKQPVIVYEEDMIIFKNMDLPDNFYEKIIEIRKKGLPAIVNVLLRDEADLIIVRNTRTVNHVIFEEKTDAGE